MNNKVLYIMRGLPSAGKSFKACAIKELRQGEIFSTDDYFMKEGIYSFNVVKLAEAHLWNQNRAMMAMIQGVSPVIIDNTHVQAWEAKVYVQAGLALKYDIVIVEPSTPWAFDVEELTKRNTHNVPKETIQRMLDRWEYNITIEQILK